MANEDTQEAKLTASEFDGSGDGKVIFPSCGKQPVPGQLLYEGLMNDDRSMPLIAKGTERCCHPDQHTGPHGSVEIGRYGVRWSSGVPMGSCALCAILFKGREDAVEMTVAPGHPHHVGDPTRAVRRFLCKRCNGLPPANAAPVRVKIEGEVKITVHPVGVVLPMPAPEGVNPVGWQALHDAVMADSRERCSTVMPTGTLRRMTPVVIAYAQLRRDGYGTDAASRMALARVSSDEPDLATRFARYLRAFEAAGR